VSIGETANKWRSQRWRETFVGAALQLEPVRRILPHLNGTVPGDDRLVLIRTKADAIGFIRIGCAA
jgi:hypothetical protein